MSVNAKYDKKVVAFLSDLNSRAGATPTNDLLLCLRNTILVQFLNYVNVFRMISILTCVWILPIHAKHYHNFRKTLAILLGRLEDEA